MSSPALPRPRTGVDPEWQADSRQDRDLRRTNYHFFDTWAPAQPAHQPSCRSTRVYSTRFGGPFFQWDSTSPGVSFPYRDFPGLALGPVIAARRARAMGRLAHRRFLAQGWCAEFRLVPTTLPIRGRILTFRKPVEGVTVYARELATLSGGRRTDSSPNGAAPTWLGHERPCLPMPTPLVARGVGLDQLVGPSSSRRPSWRSLYHPRRCPPNHAAAANSTAQKRSAGAMDMADRPEPPLGRRPSKRLVGPTKNRSPARPPEGDGKATCRRACPRVEPSSVDRVSALTRRSGRFRLVGAFPMPDHTKFRAAPRPGVVPSSGLPRHRPDRNRVLEADRTDSELPKA